MNWRFLALWQACVAFFLICPFGFAQEFLAAGKNPAGQSLFCRRISDGTLSPGVLTGRRSQWRSFEQLILAVRRDSRLSAKQRQLKIRGFRSQATLALRRCAAAAEPSPTPTPPPPPPVPLAGSWRAYCPCSTGEMFCSEYLTITFYPDGRYLLSLSGSMSCYYGSSLQHSVVARGTYDVLSNAIRFTQTFVQSTWASCPFGSGGSPLYQSDASYLTVIMTELFTLPEARNYLHLGDPCVFSTPQGLYFCGNDSARCAASFVPVVADEQ